jgi:site-specific recombinase XerD
MRDLTARNLAGKTLRTYGDSVTALVDHAAAKDLDDLDRAAIREFLADLTEQYAPATVSVRYRVSQQFFRWLVLEDEGKTFVDRRDTAIIMLFLDTGMWLSELAGLTVDDLDMDDDVAFVVGKGRRPRGCPFGAKTGQPLDRTSASGRSIVARTSRRCGSARRAKAP